jgi:hypothetical protein
MAPWTSAVTNGSGLASCAGPVPSGAGIDTSTPDQKTFTVTASDLAGNAATLTRTYKVVALTPPRITASVSFGFCRQPRQAAVPLAQRQGRAEGRDRVGALHGEAVPGALVHEAQCEGHGGLEAVPAAADQGGHAPHRLGDEGGRGRAVKTLTIRARDVKVATVCLPAGAKKPGRCAP